MGSWNLSLSTTAWTLQGPQSLAVISFRKLAWKMKRRMPEPGEEEVEGGGKGGTSILWVKEKPGERSTFGKTQQCYLSVVASKPQGWETHGSLTTQSVDKRQTKTTKAHKRWEKTTVRQNQLNGWRYMYACVLPSGCGCDLNPNSSEKSGPSQSLWQARGKTGSSSTRRDSKYARIVSSATLDSLRDAKMQRDAEKCLHEQHTLCC